MLMNECFSGDIFPTSRNRLDADQALNLCVKSWFVLALAGQLTISVYICIRNGLALLAGHPERINLSAQITGHVAGDTSGNAMLFMRVYAAALLGFSGMLQFVPKIR